MGVARCMRQAAKQIISCRLPHLDSWRLALQRLRPSEGVTLGKQVAILIQLQVRVHILVVLKCERQLATLSVGVAPSSR
jgi:hypothetical protein